MFKVNNPIIVPLENLAKRYSRYYIYIEPIVSDPFIRGYFGLAASLLLIAFFLIFALSPTINTVLALQKKIGEQRQVIKSLDQKISDIVVAQQNYAQAETLLPTLLETLPDKPNPQTIIAGVLNSASSSGLAISSLQFQNIPLSKDLIATNFDLSTIKMTFSVTGSLDQFRAFLTKLEGFPRLIRVTNLGISASDKKTTETVSAVGYYFVEKDL